MSDKFRRESERQRDYNEKIRLDIENMEKRMGLKRPPHFMDTVTQFLNSSPQTSKNIYLLKTRIKVVRSRISSNIAALSIPSQSSSFKNSHNSEDSEKLITPSFEPPHEIV